MGGNGLQSHYVSNTLGGFITDRYKKVGSIGDTKVVVVTTHETDKQPVNSFTSDMYYVVSPKDPERITHITFYNKKTHGIKKSIDIEYDADGNMIPFTTITKNGKTRTVGTHVHKWFCNEKGIYWRKSHGRNNIFSLSKTDLMYVSRAMRYNEEHAK